jgi:predicted O-linked N-acetylglucosamine transferase (SPINDLY family)
MRSSQKPFPQAECDQLVALFNAGHFGELESRARSLLEQYPQVGFVWKALGLALQTQGKDALPALQKSTELMPEDAEAHSNLGNALRDLGRLNDAVASYRRALALNPDTATWHYNLGIAQYDLKTLDDASACYRRALQISPGYAEAHSNLGNTLRDLGRLGDAMANYRWALAITPDHAEAHSNLGNALRDLGRLDDATASYRRALRIKPDHAEVRCNLGVVLRDRGRLGDALTRYRQALAFNPDYVNAHSNMGIALKDLGQLNDAVASYRRALDINPGYTEVHSNLLFLHNYLSDKPPATLLAEARRFGALAARQARPYTSWRSLPTMDRSLRVGVVSWDLRNHPVGYFVDSVFAALKSIAAGRLELIAYHCHFRTDAITERIKASCTDWRSVVGVSDEMLARQIHEDGIDILIDLSGHTANNRLRVFARKPAPVQVSWLGYFATTGVAEMDYLIADPWTLPATEEVNFTEKIWRLPETRLCFTPPDTDVAVARLPALSNGYITFGCFNNLAKMNDAVVALWAQVLRAVPESRLLLKAKQLDEASVRQSIVKRFAAEGIDADRLILEGASPRPEYLAAYHRVDIALDPFPFPGGTTSVESLWMGVPVLTLTAERFLSRQGIGILMNAGLSEWIAADKDDYVARAASHARDLGKLATLRNGLRQQLLASPIVDAPRFARHFETGLRHMWQEWCTRP